MKKKGFSSNRHSADSHCESSRICNQRMRSCSIGKPISRMTGFTLIELSIVLVIIGLIVGGVLVGQDLINAAKQRALISDIEAIKTATQTFKLKYNCLPGDCKNAVSFWGAQAGGTADGIDSTCVALTHTSPATTEATCNGDGNKQIGYTSRPHEMFRYWQQLNNAGLHAEEVTAVRGSAGTLHSVPGSNIPGTDLGDGIGINLFYRGSHASASTFSLNYGHTFLIGKGRTTNNLATERSLTPLDALSIDQKSDDGKPGSGSIIAMYWNVCSDAANNQDYTADYDLSVTNIECLLYIRNAF